MFGIGCGELAGRRTAGESLLERAQSRYIGRSKLNPWPELVARHVPKQAAAELACHGISVELPLKIDAADEQPALAKLCFEDEAQLPSGEPIIDDLHCGLQAGRQIVKDHGSSPADQIPPLPVRMVFRGKVGKERMF